MYRKNTRHARKLERKTGHVIVRFRGPRIGRAGICAAVGTTAMLSGVFRLFSSPCPPDAPVVAPAQGADAPQREGSP